MNPQPLSHLTTIGEIERVTGIDLLPGVSGSKRTEINYKTGESWFSQAIKPLARARR